ncbi:hypothetical protein [Natrinema salsiterrestre]|uniref:Uncharacterized protein n=1 Tax=Natrinema salsiterrestre TaxID=2950540 RepID=A0A9Q4Q0N5_9EURY|nr:hypothetical protein [Natrinema salsiterrestre]MDF9746189.1 hypothetical protein [Natrinema salsiterrestre]
MSDDRSGPVGQLLAAEEQFHELMPGKDIYSKLFFRTVLWFALFTAAYTIITGL